MPQKENNPWRVSYSAQLIDQLTLCFERAMRFGLDQELFDALTYIYENLRIRPLEWGDPLHQLKHLNLLICHRLYEMIYITYGVHEKEHTVFIQHIRLIPGHPLSEED